MENLTLGKLLNLFKNNFKIIILFSIIGLVVGIFYSTTLFHPTYKSTAKLLIKNPDQKTFVTELGTANGITPLTRDGNPTLTQIQILTSGKLAGKVWQEISSKYKIFGTPEEGAQLMQKSISVENPVGTDVININASWSNPKIAKDIATEFAAAYIASNIDMAKKGIVQSKDSINKELADAGRSLALTRDKIRMFKQSNSTVDLGVEAENTSSQLSTLENRYNEILSSAGAERNKVNSIANRLGIDWSKAINSVALGHNTNITEIQTRLGTAQEELAGLSSKYATTHPSIIALNSKIGQIKSELADQIEQTVGNSADNKIEEGDVVISDPVRTTMLENLVTSESAYRGLLAQSGILRSAINSLNARKSSIPNKQFVLANLSQQEANLANIVNILQTKQIEANIRESEIVSNISLIDNPVAPLFPSFPNRLHVTALFLILGALLGSISIMMSYILKDTYDNANEIEDDIKAPVFGIIPWLDKQAYTEPNSLLAIDDNVSFYSLAYQKVVSSLKINGNNFDKRTLAFTSTEFSKYRSTMLMNIAYGLAKAEQSVIVVDADFRTPTIYKEFEMIPSEQRNIAKLLGNITKSYREKQEFDWSYISYFVQKVPEANNLYVLGNDGNVFDPNEFIHSLSFQQLIQKLKERYDWVLIDTPPALAVPDAATISSYADGVVLITGLETKKSAIKKLHKLFNNHNIEIFGLIARELQINEAILSNGYLKQIISHMMPNTEEQAVPEK